jgi:hypothetical protein
MKITTDFGDLNIDDVGPDEDGWVTIQSQSVTFDKTSFFIGKFNEDFPAYNLSGSNDDEQFTFLSELCARTPAMRKWFAAVSVIYSNTTQLPLYLKDKLSPGDYKSVQDKMLILKDELAEVIKERNLEAAKYTAALERLRQKELDIARKTTRADNVMKIMLLNTEALPLSIQLKIQAYMPSGQDLDVADGRRRLAQEYLAKFKCALLDLNEKDPNLDVEALVKEIELK